ncbi:hypothetical protein K7J14_11175 [Treponema zuelzerae]|uniref:DUF5666 domain-containing protein n=1 Tax=Teretinema zuelzerae TaxID=156 RepID=A0AAE3EKN5_9SPIR|nr:hypothetical protein [Teretinema zuelzerae]MBN2811017.1 hypothetical protein [Spirochaetales bacterium]MCD1655253.1 hypothetical protein [Teretinema zuelzerae]
MKKSAILVLALTILFGAFLTAQDAAVGGYTVQSVTGKVEREVSPGKWEPVLKDSVLAPTAVVNVGLNSSLVVVQGNRNVAIKAMQKGALEKLLADSGSAKGGIKLGAKVKESSTGTELEKGRSSVSTASTRASDATNDIEWVEE